MDMDHLISKQKVLSYLKEGDTVGIVPDSIPALRERYPDLNLKFAMEYVILNINHWLSPEVPDLGGNRRPVRITLVYQGRTFEVNHTDVTISDQRYREMINNLSRSPCYCGSGKYYNSCHLKSDLEEL